MNQLRNMGEATWYSFTQALNTFMGFLPALLVALIVLVVGWFIAGFLARLIARGLSAIGLERAVERSGIGRFIEQSGTRWTMSGDHCGVDQMVDLPDLHSGRRVGARDGADHCDYQQRDTFPPKLIVALAIIVIGSLIARFVAGLVRGSLAEMEVGSAGLFAKLAQYAIIGFAIVAAFNQIGVAQTVVNTLLIGLIGSLALAFGLAFGAGGREVAAQITQSCVQQGG